MSVGAGEPVAGTISKPADIAGKCPNHATPAAGEPFHPNTAGLVDPVSRRRPIVLGHRGQGTAIAGNQMQLPIVLDDDGNVAGFRRDLARRSSRAQELIGICQKSVHKYAYRSGNFYFASVSAQPVVK
jgi:hypothetical protein